MAGGEELRCYNTSCGQKFRETENGDSACVYHPGRPYFHDGYKEWTCCKLKSADFTTFLMFKGCTTGPHNNVKPPPEPEDEDAGDGKPTLEEKAPVEQPPPEIVPFVPPAGDHLERVVITENPNIANAPPVNNRMICKNCKQDEKTLDLTTACDYHRGIQIFHDALKFWSCCAHRKFTDFDDFQKQPPCAHAEAHELMVKIDAKENWFQAADTITLALYGLKGARLAGGKTIAELRGGNTLNVQFYNTLGAQLFERTWKLFDYIIAAESKITLNQSNVQFVLRKANHGNHWKSLAEESQS